MQYASLTKTMSRKFQGSSESSLGSSEKDHCFFMRNYKRGKLVSYFLNNAAKTCLYGPNISWSWYRFGLLDTLPDLGFFFWFYCVICIFLFVCIIFFWLFSFHVFQRHHSAQLHFLLKSPFHRDHLIFLSCGLNLLQFSRCDFCFVFTFFHSQSSEYNFLVHLLFAASQFPSLNILTASPDLNSFISFVCWS